MSAPRVDPPWAPQPDLLRSTLEQLRLEGAIFFRSELTDAFAFESAPLALADSLKPGADRLILFHIVARGSCWVAVDDGVRHIAQEGDVIVLPYGDHYMMGGDSPAEVISILDLVDPLPWAAIPVIRHGGGGPQTDVVCGYLHSTHPLFDPAMRALPPVFVVRLPPGPAAGWVQASITYAMEESPPSDRSTSLLSTRLPEPVLIEVLRAHLANAPSADRGWMPALGDPVLAPALAMLRTTTSVCRRAQLSCSSASSTTSPDSTLSRSAASAWTTRCRRSSSQAATVRSTRLAAGTSGRLILACGFLRPPG